MRCPAIVFSLLLLCCVAAMAGDPMDSVGRPAAGVRTVGEPVRIKIEMPGAKAKAQIVKLEDGSMAFVLSHSGPGQDRVLTPTEFASVYYNQQSRGPWLNRLFNITSPVGFAWVAVGLGGQLLFTGRMLVQWISSERSRRSVIPVSFWWMSLIGATMLLAYFLWRRDIVGVLGQATGWVVYVRNLVLIRQSRG